MLPFENKEKKRQVESLWRDVFGDAEEFIRLYFDNIYNGDNTIVVEKDGEIVSALQLLPYTMILEGREVHVAYISGVCTRPTERGKGYMNMLMDMADAELKQRNIPMAILIPAEEWLYKVYSKQGYKKAFYYSTEIYHHNQLYKTEGINVAVVDSPVIEDIFNYFDENLRKRPFCVLHSIADLKNIIAELNMFNGALFKASNNEGDIIGLAFASLDYNNKDCVVIKELLYDDEKTKQQLLYFVATHFNTKKIRCNTPSLLDHKVKGMAKVLYTSIIDVDFDKTPAYMSLMLD